MMSEQPEQDDTVTDRKAGNEADEIQAAEQVGAKQYESLNIALRDGDAAEADRLLTALSELQRAHAESRTVREMLALGLFNALASAEEADDMPRRDTLFDHLWQLQRAWPSEEVIGRACAKALFGLLLAAERAGDEALLAARSADMRLLLAGLEGDEIPDDPMSLDMLDWLTEGSGPADDDDFWEDDGVPTVDLQDAQVLDGFLEDNRRATAKALQKACAAAVAADDHPTRKQLIQELSDLHSAWPEDRYVASRLCVGLIKSMNHERSLGSHAQLDGLLDEIHRIADWLKATQP